MPAEVLGGLEERRKRAEPFTGIVASVRYVEAHATALCGVSRRRLARFRSKRTAVLVNAFEPGMASSIYLASKPNWRFLRPVTILSMFPR